MEDITPRLIYNAPLGAVGVVSWHYLRFSCVCGVYFWQQTHRHDHRQVASSINLTRTRQSLICRRTSGRRGVATRSLRGAWCPDPPIADGDVGRFIMLVTIITMGISFGDSLQMTPCHLIFLGGIFTWFYTWLYFIFIRALIWGSPLPPKPQILKESLNWVASNQKKISPFSESDAIHFLCVWGLHVTSPVVSSWIQVETSFFF